MSKSNKKTQLVSVIYLNRLANQRRLAGRKDPLHPKESINHSLSLWIWYHLQLLNHSSPETFLQLISQIHSNLKTQRSPSSPRIPTPLHLLIYLPNAESPPSANLISKITRNSTNYFISHEIFLIFSHLIVYFIKKQNNCFISAKQVKYVNLLT